MSGRSETGVTRLALQGLLGLLGRRGCEANSNDFRVPPPGIAATD